MPSLLIEIDFISNLCVENALKDETYIKNISQSISNSLLSFVNKPIIDDNFSYCICTGKFKYKYTPDTSLKRSEFYKIFSSNALIYHKTLSTYN